MSAHIVMTTCGVVLALDLLLLCRNSWVFKWRTRLNRYENDENVIRRYVSYQGMIDRWWVWDIEKLRVPDNSTPPSN